MAMVLAVGVPSFAQGAADRLLEATWSEARALAKDWKLEGAKLQVDGAGDVYVTSSLSVVVGEKFLSKLSAEPNAHDALLFALLHELWHVHQIASDRDAYNAPGQRPILECAADARAAYTMTRQKHAVLRPDAPAPLGESVALELEQIPRIPLQFPALNDAAALSLQHLAADQRRFAALVGVLQGLSSDVGRLPKNYSAGVYGRLQRQSAALWSLFPPTGVGDQDKLNDICSYIAGGRAEKDVRVTFQKSDILQQNGQRIYTEVHRIENLLAQPIRYSFITVDGVIKKEDSDQDVTDLMAMRRTFVDVPARGSAKFQTFALFPLIDHDKFKYLPFYSLGRLDKVTIIGPAVPPPTCFDEPPPNVAAALDMQTKLAIRIGQSAMGKFDSVRGEENKLMSSELAKIYNYSFDPPGKPSGLIQSLPGLTYATLDLYEGDDKDAALEIIDRIASYAKQSCPVPEDPDFPLFVRDPANHSLDIRRFTTGSAASVVLTIPEAEDPPGTPVRVHWSITRNIVEQ
jgi:hypothetical protein